MCLQVTHWFPGLTAAWQSSDLVIAYDGLLFNNDLDNGMGILWTDWKQLLGKTCSFSIYMFTAMTIIWLKQLHPIQITEWLIFYNDKERTVDIHDLPSVAVCCDNSTLSEPVAIFISAWTIGWWDTRVTLNISKVCQINWNLLHIQCSF